MLEVLKNHKILQAILKTCHFVFAYLPSLGINAFHDFQLGVKQLIKWWKFIFGNWNWIWMEMVL
jgi:hypothetical protein